MKCDIGGGRSMYVSLGNKKPNFGFSEASPSKSFNTFVVAVVVVSFKSILILVDYTDKST